MNRRIKTMCENRNKCHVIAVANQKGGVGKM